MMMCVSVARPEVSNGWFAGESARATGMSGCERENQLGYVVCRPVCVMLASQLYRLLICPDCVMPCVCVCVCACLSLTHPIQTLLYARRTHC